MDNLVRDFYIPALRESVLYQRRTAYFNSRALAMAARGLSGLIENDGRMQMLCSVELDEGDQAVLEDPHQFVQEQGLDLRDTLSQVNTDLERARLGLLAKLLADDRLEIKVAVPERGIYHEKAGILRDTQGNIIAFNGSGNETPGGWERNIESFHVFTSWDSRPHVQHEIDTFDRLWENRHPNTTVVPLPRAVTDELIKFQDYFQKGLDEPFDPVDPVKSGSSWEWTPERAFVFTARRLWNKEKFAYLETAITPFQHQDYIASTVLDRWPPRALLADEVGLGKTIEAGLIIKGFRAAGRIQRCLILAPAAVLDQWQQEMYSKFGIEAWILDGDHVLGPQLDPKKPPPKEPVDAANPFRSKDILIASSQLLRLDHRQDQALDLDYDLVVLDEAHHARATGRQFGKREGNKLLQFMEALRYQTQGLLLMTATPIQLNRRELWDLLNLLELPGKWQDEDAFDRFFQEVGEEHPDWGFLFSMIRDAVERWPVKDADIEEVSREYQDVNVYRLEGLLRDGNPAQVASLSDRQREALRLLLFRCTPARRLVFRNTRELLKEYKRQGIFDADIADREPHARSVELSGSEDDDYSESGLYHRIDQYVKDYYKRYDDLRKGLGFIMVTYRKRLTSSLYAIERSLEKRLKKLETALETGDASDALGALATEDEAEEDLQSVTDDLFQALAGEGELAKQEKLLEVVRAERDFLRAFVSDLKALPDDSKAAEFDQVLQEIFSKGAEQVIVFSQYTDTVDYLLDYFLPQYSTRLGSYTGRGGSYWDGSEWKTCSKQEIQAKFKDPEDPLSILICTDAASEGLNLQTCSQLINYDLPWNPMRVEQRVGRVDRIGQKSPVVDVYTLFYQDTVETKVYERCLDRINLFKSALGHLQPILNKMEEAIHEAAMGSDRSEDEILSDLDETMDQTVAEADERLRIDKLVNHYEPRLEQSRERDAPITQDHLEEVLAPLLEQAGWVRDGDVWYRRSEAITFEPKYLDEHGGDVDLVTPLSSLAKYVDEPPELPFVVDDDDAELHRLEAQGHVGWVRAHDARYHLADRLHVIAESRPGGRSFESKEQAQKFIEHQLKEQRRQQLEADKELWENRLDNWDARVELYLDRLAFSVYRRAKKSAPADQLSEDGFIEAWREYIQSSERKLAQQLADLVSYLPEHEDFKSRRGRAPKNPRSREKEREFLDERSTVLERLEEVRRKLGQ